VDIRVDMAIAGEADAATAAEAGAATVAEAIAGAATAGEILAMADGDSRAVSPDKPAEVEVIEADSPDTVVATAAAGLALVLGTLTPPDPTGVAIMGTPTLIPTTITLILTGRRTTRVQEWRWVSSEEVMGLVGPLLVVVDGAVSDGKIALCG
jgi:hypothetical protein